MSHDMKHIFFANALYLTPYVSQGSAATYLRGGGSFNSVFFRISFLNLILKKNYENWFTFAEVIIKIKVAHIFETQNKNLIHL